MRIAFALLTLLVVSAAAAHEVSESDVRLISERGGLQLGTYAWLGAKHMVTGYDHVLFLVGVIFYLKTIRQVAVYVSLFALGHTITLISGVLGGIAVNAYVVDAIIGLSVAYKGFDNLGGFDRLFGQRPDEKLAVLIFGLFHGLGLGTKLTDLGLSPDGLLGNLLSFNVGVEFGQLAALVVIVFLLRVIPGRLEHGRAGTVVNSGLIIAGFLLIGWQMRLMGLAAT